MNDEFTDSRPEFYYCWVPEYGHFREDAYKISGRPKKRGLLTDYGHEWALDHEQAAEKYVGVNFSRWDYPNCV